MFKLDDNLLKELGLGSLPPAEKNKMLNHIYETLEMRVGMKLAQKMTNDQLNEFESFIDRSDEAGALRWLESNFPDYKQVVANELEILKEEIRLASPQIVAASQQLSFNNTPPQNSVSGAGLPISPSSAQGTADQRQVYNNVDSPMRDTNQNIAPQVTDYSGRSYQSTNGYENHAVDNAPIGTPAITPSQHASTYSSRQYQQSYSEPQQNQNRTPSNVPSYPQPANPQYPTPPSIPTQNFAQNDLYNKGANSSINLTNTPLDIRADHNKNIPPYNDQHAQ